MLFSVVIPSYNRAALIGRTLATVFAQTFSDFEVIVVDDGSTDGSVEVIEAFGPRLRLIRQQNAGPGPARNAGVEAAKGEYIAFLDSDDLWRPWTLEVYASLIERHKRPSVLCAFPTTFQVDSEIEGTPRREERVEVYADYLRSDPVNIVPGAGTLVVKREVLRVAGGFTSERINAEDADLYLRLGVAPGFIVVREPLLIGYRTHAGAQNLDIAKSVAGRLFIASGESSGRYPGGPARRGDRLRIVCSHLRSGAVEALYVGAFASGWRLYLAGLWWNLRTGRAKFVLAYPLLWLAHVLGLKRPPLDAPRTATMVATGGRPTP